MARFTGFDEVYSALYVDFDNIYTRFLEADPEAARAFGMAPYRWVRWIENHALRILYGQPPKTFDFEYTDTDKVYHCDRGLTPKQFLDKYVGSAIRNSVTISSAAPSRWWTVRP